MAYIVKRDGLSSEAVAIYKSLVPNAGFVLVEHLMPGYSYSDDMLQASVIKNARRRLKRFHLVKFTPVSSSLVCYATNIHLSMGVASRKEGISYTERTGAFKLEFSDGSIMILFKWLSGSGQSMTVTNMMVGESTTFYNFIKFNNQEKKNQSKPKNGIYTIKQDGNGSIYYTKLKKIQHTPVVHPSVEAVTSDLDNYFENVSEFTKYGMSGVRKILLVGPPGTGKSSYAYQIASRHKISKSVVFASNVNPVASHLSKCSKANVPTIIIWEDAESTGLNQAGSAILNFLDGIDQPATKTGAYIIMTTNFPELIDSRIKKRPGRVDRIFEFGVLKAEFALKCAQIYFYDLFNFKFSDKSEEAREHFTKLAGIVSGMSGASIKGLAYSSKLYAAGQKLPITLELVAQVKEGLDEDLKNIDKYADADDKPTVGFQKVSNDKLDTLDWAVLCKE